MYLRFFAAKMEPMPGTAYLFQWDAAEAAKTAARLQADGWSVRVESEDGSRGVRRILDDPPQVIVLDLARRPSHSRETAAAIRGYRLGRYIPMLFLDGTVEDVGRTKDRIRGAVFTGSEFLLERLAGFDL